jgi:hypothetical protein
MQNNRTILPLMLAVVCLCNAPALSQTRRRPTAQPSNPPAAAPKRPVTVTVRKGNPLVGNFIQADANIVQIEVNGVRQTIKADDVVSIAFTNPASPNQAETAQASTPAISVKSEYDAAKDETHVEFPYMKVYADSRHALLMGMVATFKGRKPETLPTIAIGFLSVSDKWQYEAFHNSDGSGKGTLRILVDGRPLSLTQDSYDTYRRPSVDEGRAVEQIGMRPSMGFGSREVAKLATAQRIDVQLAYTCFTLDSNQLEAVREFVRRVMP